MKHIRKISLNSILPVFLEPTVNAKPLGVTATGFLVTNSKNDLFLITNRHVITGRHNFTDAPLCAEPKDHQTPQELKVQFQDISKVGMWLEKNFPLFDDNYNSLYIERKIGDEYIDIAALPIKRFAGLGNTERSLQSLRPSKHVLAIQDKVAVVGFPFGRTVKETFDGVDFNFPIWSTGFVASEANVEANNRPVFFIDCRTREGQSGSPVIATDQTRRRQCNEDGTIEIIDVPHTLFGIYSGRIEKDSDIGMVWKTSAIIDLIESV